MKKNAKVSLFVILFGFSNLLMRIILLLLAITWWDIIFIQLTNGLIFLLSSILLIMAGAYLILRFIS
ncbi:MAG: hypothetical protein ACFE9T_00915 [Promethearchaeota archaeon]